MANISFFARLVNIWKGFLSLWIEDVEKNHPEIAYQNAIDSAIDKYSKLKTATASIIRRREDINDRLQKERRELDKVLADLEAALDTQQDDLALVLLQKKEKLTESVRSLEADQVVAEKDADDAKAALLDVKASIDNLRAEKDRMLAQFQSAEARVKIQNQLDGLSVDAEVRALDNVRTHIKNTVAQANLNQELKDNDLDTRLAKLRTSSGAITAQRQLDELKKARAASREGAAGGNGKAM